MPGNKIKKQEIHIAAARATPGDLGLKSHPKDCQQGLIGIGKFKTFFNHVGRCAPPTKPHVDCCSHYWAYHFTAEEKDEEEELTHYYGHPSKHKPRPPLLNPIVPGN